MLYNGLEINGGKVYLPPFFTDNTVIVHTDAAVWAWHHETGAYYKLTVVEGSPFTEAFVPKQNEVPSAKSERSWAKDMK